MPLDSEICCDTDFVPDTALVTSWLGQMYCVLCTAFPNLHDLPRFTVDGSKHAGSVVVCYVVITHASSQ